MKRPEGTRPCPARSNALREHRQSRSGTRLADAPRGGVCSRASVIDLKDWGHRTVPPLDHAVIATLFRRWGPLIYRRCCRILGSEDEAQDGVQEVFLRLLRMSDAYEEQDRVLHLAYRIATNWCLNRLRDRRLELPAFDLSEIAAVSPGPAPETAVVHRDALARLFAACDDETRLIVYLRFHDGLTQDEIAETAGVSRKTVQRKLDRFLSRVRS